jgi:hypothetical protein
MAVRFKIGEHKRMDALKYLVFKYGQSEVDRMINERVAEIHMEE